jgi:hypothetical protein
MPEATLREPVTTTLRLPGQTAGRNYGVKDPCSFLEELDGD